MNDNVLQDKLYHHLRMVDAEMLERRAQKLESLAFGVRDSDMWSVLQKQAKELRDRADAIRDSLKPKG